MYVWRNEYSALTPLGDYLRPDSLSNLVKVWPNSLVVLPFSSLKSKLDVNRFEWYRCIKNWLQSILIDEH